MVKPLSPSSASRRIACPGSYKMESQFSERESPHAKEGTVAHEIAAEFLRYPRLRAMCGESVTSEMIEGAKLYRDFIHSKKCLNLHIEEEIIIPTIHWNCKGTPDCWGVDRKDNIHLFDYKFGFGFVEVFENWQLLEYAAAIVPNFRLIHFPADITVNMHIIQPRSFHKDGPIRSWSITLDKIQFYFEKLRNIENAAMADNPVIKVSPECNYCTARHACPALAQAALASVDMAHYASTHELKPTEVNNELRILHHAQELLDARISGLEAEALEYISQGKSLPHYRAEHSEGRQQWNIPIEKVIKLGKALEIDIVKEREVITPKQTIKAGADPKLINKYSETKRGPIKLVQTDLTEIRKIFE